MAVPGVAALGLGKLVDLTADEADESLLGELVVDGVAWGRVSGAGWDWTGGRKKHTLSTLLVLVVLHGSERGSTGDSLVRELALVVRLVTVDVAVVLLAVVWDWLAGRTGSSKSADIPQPNILSEGIWL